MTAHEVLFDDIYILNLWKITINPLCFNFYFNDTPINNSSTKHVMESTKGPKMTYIDRKLY